MKKLPFLSLPWAIDWNSSTGSGMY